MFNRSVILVALLLLSSGTYAAGILGKLGSNPPGKMDYQYVSAYYLDVDNFGDGFGFTGSFPVRPNLAISVYYDAASENSVDFSLFGADALIHQTLPKVKDTDLLYGIGFARAKAEVSGASNSETGLIFTVGTRTEVNPDIEFNTRLQLETVDDTDIQVGLGGVVQLTDDIYLNVDWLFADTDVLKIGARYYY